MRNRYPGTCYRCGETVKAGDGHFERHTGSWRVQHASCANVPAAFYSPSAGGFFQLGVTGAALEGVTHWMPIPPLEEG